MRRSWYLSLVLPIALTAAEARAQQFSAGMPVGWTCEGTCGTLGADGDVTLDPSGGSRYGYVVTSFDGPYGLGLPGAGGSGIATSGSRLRTTAFSALAGAALSFDFDYVSSDGPGYSDYAWARLLNADLSEAALLFAVQTQRGGSSPFSGSGMPDPEARLSNERPGMHPKANPLEGPLWSPLAESSGSCYEDGCGSTGWVNASYRVGAAGSYILEFGVVNWDDTDTGFDVVFQSGLAFDNVRLNGAALAVTPPAATVAPEPATLALLATGLLGLGAVARRRRTA